MYCNFNGLKNQDKEIAAREGSEQTICPHKFRITNSHKLNA